MDKPKVGTKERFRSWLQAKHCVTTSQYGKLPIERKLELQTQYQGKAKA